MATDRAVIDKPSTTAHRYVAVLSSFGFVLLPVFWVWRSVLIGDAFGLILACIIAPITAIYAWRRPIARVVALDEQQRTLTVRTLVGTRCLSFDEVVSVRRDFFAIPGVPTRVQVVTNRGRGLTRLSYIVVADSENRLWERLRAVASPGDAVSGT